MLDLVATGFNKPEHLFGASMRDKDDVDAAADAFRDKYIRVSVRHCLPACVGFEVVRVWDSVSEFWGEGR